MATLLFVRHGQASAFTGGDYDQLSPLGEQQAAALGRWLAGRDQRFARVFVGPRRRHAQTHDAIVAAYREARLPLPEHVVLESLDETDGPLAIAKNLSNLAERFPEVRDAMAAAGSSGDPRGWLRALQTVVRLWSRGELDAAGLPTWRDFRATVAGALDRMVAELPKGDRVLVLTSGGTTAAALAHALDLDDDRAVDLMLALRNAAFSTIRVARDRLQLGSFNEVPHLPDESMHTLV